MAFNKRGYAEREEEDGRDERDGKRELEDGDWSMHKIYSKPVARKVC